MVTGGRRGNEELDRDMGLPRRCSSSCRRHCQLIVHAKMLALYEEKRSYGSIRTQKWYIHDRGRILQHQNFKKKASKSENNLLKNNHKKSSLSSLHPCYIFLFCISLLFVQSNALNATEQKQVTCCY